LPGRREGPFAALLELDAGLVRRWRHRSDRRAVRVELTARGQRILARLSARNRRELRDLRRVLQRPHLGEPGASA